MLQNAAEGTFFTCICVLTRRGEGRQGIGFATGQEVAAQMVRSKGYKEEGRFYMGVTGES